MGRRDDVHRDGVKAAAELPTEKRFAAVRRQARKKRPFIGWL